MSGREREIDLLKYIACVLVVVLHSISPSEDIPQETVYLLGSFAIPMFFMVNGYLRANKEFTFGFAAKMLLRYEAFILMWSVIVGMGKLILLKKNCFLELFIGANTAKNDLFHLWFLPAIVVIYFLAAIANTLSKAFFKKSITSIGQERDQARKNTIVSLPFVIVYLLLTIVFVFELVLMRSYGKEIRELGLPCFRIITNGGYWMIGVIIARIKDNVVIPRFSAAMIALAFVITVVTSRYAGMMWASSYYAFLPVVIGTLLIFLLTRDVTKNRISDRLGEIINTSTGIWIFHPFVVKVLNKLYTMYFGDLSLLPRCGILIFTVIICMLISLIIGRIKYIRRLIMP